MSTLDSSFHGFEPAPISLQSAIVIAEETGTMRVTLDGAIFAPPVSAENWKRGHFGQLLDVHTLGRTHTVRVEVHEFDGSVFTDIVHAARREQPIADVQSLTKMRRARHRPTDQLIEVTGSGFVPGEDVTVALSVSSTEGSADGSARSVIDVRQLVDHRSEILLIGRVSGVIVTESLRS